MGRLQPLSAKFGEVKFRQKLVKQHLGKKGLIPEEPSPTEILEILKNRVNATRKILKKLVDQDFPLSPFLEIGAEKGQRSMLLVNEFGAVGFASDLSFESLASAKKFASLLCFKKLPTLVCCDAYCMPFANNSFPFVFSFETLHHFPNPTLIIKEIFRVLTPGGVFYFGEEPVKQTLNLNLWHRSYHLRPFEKFLKAIGILPFVSRIGKTETSHGILEEEFSLITWKKALSSFDKVEANVKPVFFGPQSGLIKKGRYWQNPKLMVQVLMFIQGGGIEGLGIKRGKLKIPKNIVLICPDCQKKLTNTKKGFSCLRCKVQFIEKDNVLMLLPTKLQDKLYG